MFAEPAAPAQAPSEPALTESAIAALAAAVIAEPAVPAEPAPHEPDMPALAEPVVEPRAPVLAARPEPVRDAPAVRASTVQEIHARPAPLWRRVLSFGVDAAAISAVAAVYLLLASSVVGVKVPATGLSGLDALVLAVQALQPVLLPGLALVLVLSLAYGTVAAFLWNGRTLGRRLLGLQLVDTHGTAPGPLRSLVRALLATLSFGLFLAGFWMALFDRRGQTLHDKLTSTFVVQPS
jgi:resuscitation-promoting factor RpfA